MQAASDRIEAAFIVKHSICAVLHQQTKLAPPTPSQSCTRAFSIRLLKWMDSSGCVDVCALVGVCMCSVLRACDLA
jgi:hypothetical protein